MMPRVSYRGYFADFILTPESKTLLYERDYYLRSRLHRNDYEQKTPRCKHVRKFVSIKLRLTQNLQ